MCDIEGSKTCESSPVDWLSFSKVRRKFIDFWYRLTRSVSDSANCELAKLCEYFLSKDGNFVLFLLRECFCVLGPSIRDLKFVLLSISHPLLGLVIWDTLLRSRLLLTVLSLS